MEHDSQTSPTPEDDHISNCADEMELGEPQSNPRSSLFGQGREAHEPQSTSLFGSGCSIDTQHRPNKSPRREDEDDPASLRSQPKKLCVSLSAVAGYQLDDDPSPETPGTGLGTSFSTLDLEEEPLDIDDNDMVDSDVDFGATLRSSEDQDPQSSPSLRYDLSREGSRGAEDPRATPEDPREAYGLRKGIDRNDVGTTHLDVDQSGNYDPMEETRQKMLRLRQARQAKKDKASPKKLKGKLKADLKKKCPKRVVSLQIHNKGTLLNILEGDEDNWPDGHSDLDSEDEQEREEIRSRYRQKSPDYTPQIPIADPAEILNDLTGYPMARGCIRCRQNLIHCSMIENGEFPCTDCENSPFGCHPIVANDLSGPCVECDVRSQSCSFEVTGANQTVGSDVQMCVQCHEQRRFECIPRPPRKSARIDLNQLLYGVDRPYVTCTHCRADKKRCSLKQATDKPPCKRCKREGLGCTFEDLPDQGKPKEKAKRKRKEKKPAKQPKTPKPVAPKKNKYSAFIKGPLRTKLEEIAPECSIPCRDDFDEADLLALEQEHSVDKTEDMQPREDSPDMEMEDAHGNRGILTTIKTSFAHPMQFQIQDPDPETCEFCELPFFGPVGHYERTVHVLKWDNGLGFTEIANGHQEENAPTLMCRNCVLQRMQIMCCTGHNFRPLSDISQNQNEAMAQLLETAEEPASPAMKYEMQRWCSLCLSVAKFKCKTKQSDMEDQPIKGCGLRLCEFCHDQLDQVFNNDFDSLVTSFDAEPKAKEDQLDKPGDIIIRADVGFLCKSGLVMAAVEASAAPPDDDDEVDPTL